MATKTEGRVFIATDSGSAQAPDGETFVFVRGVTRVREGHRLLKVAGHYFEPISDHVQYEVEQATKAPGEKRS